jgi:hypothetical protein
MRWCAVLLLAVLVGACGSASQAEPSPPGATGQPSTAGPSASTSPIATALPVGSQVTPEDAELIDAFVAFALNPDATALGRLALSPDGVRLGLGKDLLLELPVTEADSASAWQLRPEGNFRGHAGSFSVLESVRRHVEQDAQDSAMRTSGDIQMSLGEHPHCAGPPVPPPRGLEAMRRVSLQPAGDSITSCIAWFTADLFLDRDRNIVSVTLDLWEP